MQKGGVVEKYEHFSQCHSKLLLMAVLCNNRAKIWAAGTRDFVKEGLLQVHDCTICVVYVQLTCGRHKMWCGRIVSMSASCLFTCLCHGKAQLILRCMRKCTCLRPPSSTVRCMWIIIILATPDRNLFHPHPCSPAVLTAHLVLW